MQLSRLYCFNNPKSPSISYFFSLQSLSAGFIFHFLIVFKPLIGKE